MTYKNNRIDIYKTKVDKKEMSNEVVNINSIEDIKNILKCLKEIGYDLQ